jgi:hypothetical protein
MMRWVYTYTPPTPYPYDVQSERTLHFKFRCNILHDDVGEGGEGRYSALTEGNQECKHFYTGNVNGRQNAEYLGVHKIVILKMILAILRMKLWSTFIWLRIKLSDQLL